MFVTPQLTIDVGAIVANWQTLREKFTGRETAAVVKANAYGLGVEHIAPALEKAGCNTFFVATLNEGIQLRALLPDVRILVFHGVQQGEEFAFRQHTLIPVLNSLPQVERWKAFAKEHTHATSALHIDTGMARMGLEVEQFESLMKADASVLKDCRVGLLMSHFACAPAASHPMNIEQLNWFNHVRNYAPEIPASLCNSGGIYLASDYHFDLARPGCSLYGIAPQAAGNPMRQVVTWNAPILMTRVLEREQTVGYGATETRPKGARIATVATGYADGYLRHASGHGAIGYVGNRKVPLVGRVTMDMLCFDVSDVPESEVAEGAHITLLGDKDGIRVDDVANAAQTIGYEVLCALGNRLERKYI